MEKNTLFEKATLAAGCFWCTEAIFNRLKGVITVIPGYTGGIQPNPTYTDVSTGMTKHAEAIQITFDPSVIAYDTILEVFWHTHDPTRLNQQDADKGTQYRSAIFYHTYAQKQIALKSKKLLGNQKSIAHQSSLKLSLLTIFIPLRTIIRIIMANISHTTHTVKSSSIQK